MTIFRGHKNAKIRCAAATTTRRRRRTSTSTRTRTITRTTRRKITKNKNKSGLEQFGNYQAAQKLKYVPLTRAYVSFAISEKTRLPRRTFPLTAMYLYSFLCV